MRIARPAPPEIPPDPRPASRADAPATHTARVVNAAAYSDRLQQADLRATARRLLILEVIASLPEDEVNAVAVLRETYARGIYIPLPTVYRIIRELKRRGVVKPASAPAVARSGR